MVSFRSLVSSLFIAAVTAQSNSSTSNERKGPPPPELTFLYTSFVNISTPVDYGVGPLGDRLVIPITGGWFFGPWFGGAFAAHRSLSMSRAVLHFRRKTT
jgi:hypothetical protein